MYPATISLTERCILVLLCINNGEWWLRKQAAGLRWRQAQARSFIEQTELSSQRLYLCLVSILTARIRVIGELYILVGRAINDQQDIQVAIFHLLLQAIHAIAGNSTDGKRRLSHWCSVPCLRCRSIEIGGNVFRQ